MTTSDNIPTTPPPYSGTAPQLPPVPPVAVVHAAPAPVPVTRPATPGARFRALLLDLALLCGTAGIGWLIWSLITWEYGQTPAGRLMGHVVVHARTGQPLARGEMAVRELLIKGALGYALGLISGGIYYLVDGLLIFGKERMTLHDKMVGSTVNYR